MMKDFERKQKVIFISHYFILFTYEEKANFFSYDVNLKMQNLSRNSHLSFISTLYSNSSRSYCTKP